MLEVILRVLAVRRAQALIVLLLAALATAAAASAPLYRAVAAGQAAREELRSATAAELTVTATAELADPRDGEDFGSDTADLFAGLGFAQVAGLAKRGGARAHNAVTTSSLVYRDGVCAQVAMVAGECRPAGTGEVIVSLRGRAHQRPGGPGPANPDRRRETTPTGD